MLLPVSQREFLEGGEPWLHHVPLFGGLRPWRFSPWSLGHVQGLVSACPSLHLESMFARATRVVQEGPHSMLACDLKCCTSLTPRMDKPVRGSRQALVRDCCSLPFANLWDVRREYSHAFPPIQAYCFGMAWRGWTGFESPVLLHTNGDSPARPARHWASDVQEAELAIGPRTSPVGVPKLAGNQPSDASGIGSKGTGTPPRQIVTNLVATTLW